MRVYNVCAFVTLFQYKIVGAINIDCASVHVSRHAYIIWVVAYICENRAARPSIFVPCVAVNVLCQIIYTFSVLRAYTYVRFIIQPIEKNQVIVYALLSL